MPVLNWLNRDEHLNLAERVPYRLLEEVPALGCGDPDTGNLLVQGDNLDALKALLPFYAGQVKCIYIDPPFNTGQAFDHYDDNLEHSIWLGIIYPRLKLLRDFLALSGTIVVHLDDEELAYCIVLLDEIFGRRNRVNICTFKQGSAVGHKAINPGVVTTTNYLVIYARDKATAWTPNRVFTKRERDKRYSSYIENSDDAYSHWRLIPLSQAFSLSCSEKPADTKKRLGKHYETALADFVLKNANRVVQPVPPSYDGVGKETRILIDQSKQDPSRVYLQTRTGYSNIYLCKGKRWLFYKDKLKTIDGELVAGEPLTNLWDDLLSNNLHNEGDVVFPKGKKPEALIKRVLDLFTHPGDLVMDSFLGSGTTAAVAHKMGRRYIGIEMGEHARTHCAARLRKVVEGEQGGISQAVRWTGGGGFRFFKLGGEVFETDGRIKSGLTFDQLAAHIWFSETYTPWKANHETHEKHEKEKKGKSTFLGVHDGTAYALLYNGVLGDRAPDGGNVLTSKTLKIIKEDAGAAKYDKLVVYGECALGAAWKHARIEFKQIPYDVKAR